MKWVVEFYPKEIAAHAVYDVAVFLQNGDGAGDPDIRRKKIATDWVAAQAQPVDRHVTAVLDRNWLNEDWLLGPFGDTTDEWNAEVVFTPFKLPAETKRITDEQETLRREFAP